MPQQPVEESGRDSRFVASSTPQPARANRVGAADFHQLADLVADNAVTDIFVNGPRDVWVDRGHGVERQAHREFSESEVRALAVRLVSLGGRHVDEASPCVDVRLHDGIRVHAVLPPVSSVGTLLSIRIPHLTPLSLDDLEVQGLFDRVPKSIVLDAVRARENLLITGAGGSGKTTLLGALLGAAAPTERIIAIEDVAELRVAHPHFLSLEARQPNLEGAGGIGLSRLLREALRMRPDRLVLGECRGAEVRELLGALNTGHDGGAGTLHANSLADVPARLEALGALAELSPTAMARQAVSAIGLVLHLERVGARRSLSAIGRLALNKRDRLIVTPVAGR
jgi:pilus assembly protein CpaF